MASLNWKVHVWPTFQQSPGKTETSEMLYKAKARVGRKTKGKPKAKMYLISNDGGQGSSSSNK